MSLFRLILIACLMLAGSVRADEAQDEAQAAKERAEIEKKLDELARNLPSADFIKMNLPPFLDGPALLSTTTRKEKVHVPGTSSNYSFSYTRRQQEVLRLFSIVPNDQWAAFSGGEMASQIAWAEKQRATYSEQRKAAKDAGKSATEIAQLTRAEENYGALAEVSKLISNTATQLVKVTEMKNGMGKDQLPKGDSVVYYRMVDAFRSYVADPIQAHPLRGKIPGPDAPVAAEEKPVSDALSMIPNPADIELGGPGASDAVKTAHYYFLLDELSRRDPELAGLRKVLHSNSGDGLSLLRQPTAELQRQALVLATAAPELIKGFEKNPSVIDERFKSFENAHKEAGNLGVKGPAASRFAQAIVQSADPAATLKAHRTSMVEQMNKLAGEGKEVTAAAYADMLKQANVAAKLAPTVTEGASIDEERLKGVFDNSKKFVATRAKEQAEAAAKKAVEDQNTLIASLKAGFQSTVSPDAVAKKQAELDAVKKQDDASLAAREDQLVSLLKEFRSSLEKNGNAKTVVGQMTADSGKPVPAWLDDNAKQACFAWLYSFLREKGIEADKAHKWAEDATSRIMMTDAGSGNWSTLAGHYAAAFEMGNGGSGLGLPGGAAHALAMNVLLVPMEASSVKDDKGGERSVLSPANARSFLGHYRDHLSEIPIAQPPEAVDQYVRFVDADERAQNAPIAIASLFRSHASVEDQARMDAADQARREKATQEAAARAPTQAPAASSAWSPGTKGAVITGAVAVAGAAGLYVWSRSCKAATEKLARRGAQDETSRPTDESVAEEPEVAAAPEADTRPAAQAAAPIHNPTAAGPAPRTPTGPATADEIDAFQRSLDGFDFSLLEDDAPSKPQPRPAARNTTPAVSAPQPRPAAAATPQAQPKPASVGAPSASPIISSPSYPMRPLPPAGPRAVGSRYSNRLRQ